MTILLEKRNELELALSFPYKEDWSKRAREMKGSRWCPLEKVWFFPYTLASLEKFLDLFDQDDYQIELLGHQSSKTTERYTHVAVKDVRRIQSPLDRLMDQEHRGEQG